MTRKEEDIVQEMFVGSTHDYVLFVTDRARLFRIKGEEAEEAAELSAGALLMQVVATSIDALSVGFTISEYGWLMALAASLIIACLLYTSRCV